MACSLASKLVESAEHSFERIRRVINHYMSRQLLVSDVCHVCSRLEIVEMISPSYHNASIILRARSMTELGEKGFFFKEDKIKTRRERRRGCLVPTGCSATPTNTSARENFSGPGSGMPLVMNRVNASMIAYAFT